MNTATPHAVLLYRTDRCELLPVTDTVVDADCEAYRIARIAQDASNAEQLAALGTQLAIDPPMWCNDD